MALTTIDVIDVTLFIAFIIFLLYFGRKHRHKIDRQGLLFLYRTKFGINLIEKFSKRFAKILRPTQYLVIFIGIILMIFFSLYLIYTVYLYASRPEISEAIRAPPIFPIFPYFTKFFGLSAFFPEFPFIPFIIALFIVIFVHEFAHGVFARLNKIRIHSTGLAAFAIFPGAFVEQDDGDMDKAPRFAQLSVLGAGVFANILTALFFTIILWIFFAISFSPSGLLVQDYSYEVLNVSQIEMIAGLPLASYSFPDSDQTINITSGGQSYVTSSSRLKQALDSEASLVAAYINSPAIKNQILSTEGVNIISKINGEKISSYDDLREKLSKKSGGDKINLEMKYSTGETKEFEITLEEYDDRAMIGVSLGASDSKKSIMGLLYNVLPNVNNRLSGIHYESNIRGYGLYIFYLFWWIIVINVLVALTNMLPVGMFDGGRFFMILVWSITGKKETGEKAFKYSTYLILLLLLVLMIRWSLRFF